MDQHRSRHHEPARDRRAELTQRELFLAQVAVTVRQTSPTVTADARSFVVINPTLAAQFVQRLRLIPTEFPSLSVMAEGSGHRSNGRIGPASQATWSRSCVPSLRQECRLPSDTS